MLDFSKPIYFYDDRAKSGDIFKLFVILYQDSQVCLCMVKPEEKVDFMFSPADTRLLFDVNTGNVLHSDFEYWMASNDIDFLK